MQWYTRECRPFDASLPKVHIGEEEFEPKAAQCELGKYDEVEVELTHVFFQNRKNTEVGLKANLPCEV